MTAALGPFGELGGESGSMGTGADLHAPPALGSSMWRELISAVRMLA